MILRTLAGQPVAFRVNWPFRSKAHYAHYAPSGKLDVDGLIQVLADAGIGSVMTRRMYARSALADMDMDKDGLVSEDELRAAMTKYSGAGPVS